MAQRNPMNDRYQGDGPQGKTRKSAAKLKPKTEAASSVHIERKPTTKQERKAARKKRDAQAAAKEKARKLKAEERERQARIDAGEEIEEPKPEGVGSKVKGFLLKPTTASGQGPSKGEVPLRAQGVNSPEYLKYKRIYWILMGIGVAAILGSIMINISAPELASEWYFFIPMGIAYIAVIGAFVIDFTKIRKMQRSVVKSVDGRMSPKQQKHEQEKREAALALEAQKKAEKELKRANSKLPFARKAASGAASVATNKDASASASAEASAAGEAGVIDAEETSNVKEESTPQETKE